MRKYIRHPSSIPIEYSLEPFAQQQRRRRLKNIGGGGLCFAVEDAVPTGSSIHVRVAVVSPVFEANGLVVWSRRQGDQYEVGVRFDDSSVAFALRMVEQVCYIEHYRQQVMRDQGRRLSSDEAAAEWIAGQAADFPGQEH